MFFLKNDFLIFFKEDHFFCSGFTTRQCHRGFICLQPSPDDTSIRTDSWNPGKATDRRSQPEVVRVNSMQITRLV